MSLGTIIGGKFRLDELLGEGSYGEVYLSTNLTIGQRVAIKILHAHVTTREMALNRFKREAKAAGMLRHPGICPVFDFGTTEDGRAYCVMEFLEGRTLSSRISEAGKLNVQEAIPLFVQVCDAMDAAHSAGILHRDLTPTNIMITGDQRAILVDFGLAKITQAEAADDKSLTASGTVIGTPHYMSPEQCLGSDIDARSDIYSLGCIMYEALTGRTPFDALANLEVMRKHVIDPVAPIDRRLAIPSHIESAIMKALKKRPEERQQTMAQLKNDLTTRQKLVGHIPAAPHQWRPVITCGLVVSAIAATTIFGYSTLKDRHAQVAQQPAIKQPAPPALTISDAMAKAMSAYERYDQHGTLMYLDQVVALADDPSTPADKRAAVLMQATRIYDDTGMINDSAHATVKAIACIRSYAKDANPDLIQAQAQLAECYLDLASERRMNDLDDFYPQVLYKAETLATHLTDVLKANGDQPEQLCLALAVQGQCWLLQGKFHKCADRLTALLPELPKAPETFRYLPALYCNNATALTMIGRPAEALRQLQEALKLMPANRQSPAEVGEVYATMAHAYQYQGDNTRAAQYFARAKDCLAKTYDPHMMILNNWMSRFQIASGDVRGYPVLKQEFRPMFTPMGARYIYHGSVFDAPPSLNERSTTFYLAKDRNHKPLSTYNLQNFDTVDLSGTDTTDKDLAALASLPKLRRLRLIATDITDGAAPYLAKLRDLEEIDISATPAGTATAKALAGLPHLVRIEANFAQFGNEALAQLASSTSLGQLSVRGTPATDKGIVALSASRSLTALDIGFTMVTDAGVASLSGTTQLEQLELTQTLINGSSLHKLPQLRRLSVVCPITDHLDLSGIEGMHHLQKLNLPVIGDGAIKYLPQLSELTQLTLHGTDFGDDSMTALQKLPNLSVLDLNHTNITDGSVRFFSLMSNLIQLDIGQNRIEHISSLRGLPKVKRLSVANDPIQDGTADLFLSMPHLKTLDISDTPLSAATIFAIANSGKLTGLLVEDCRLTHHDVYELDKVVPILYFDFTDWTSGQLTSLHRAVSGLRKPPVLTDPN
jgi:serine/threonine protein kinase/Leucine-rich repeat (LRR) protein